MAFVKTAVFNTADGTFVGVARNAKERDELTGGNNGDFTFVTRKDFAPTEQFPTWEEMIGESKPAGDKPASTRKQSTLEGVYHVTKKFSRNEGDARNVFADAMVANSTFEDYLAAVADTTIDLPSSRNAEKTNKITGSAYIRYALQRGWVARGEQPTEEQPAGEEQATA